MNEVRNEERTEEKGQEKNTKRLETIKKEDKKFYWKFIALCGIGGIIGGTAGFLMSFLDDYMAAGELSFPEIFLMVQRNLVIPFRYLTVAVGCYFLYQNFLHCTFVFPSGASAILPILNL